MNRRERFAAIQRRYAVVQEREATLEGCFLRKYGTCRPSSAWITRGEQDKIDAIGRAADREINAMFALLDEVSPRHWRSGAPFHWVMTSLTWDDAITGERLSVVPPAAYGYSTRDAEAFASAL